MSRNRKRRGIIIRNFSKQFASRWSKKEYIAIIILLIFIGLGIIWLNSSKSISFSQRPTIAQTITTPTPTVPPEKDSVVKTVIHTADPLKSTVLTYTYTPTNGFANYLKSRGFRGFTIDYPGNWDFVIYTTALGQGMQNARDTLVISYKENALIIDQPIEGAGCFYPPKPTGPNYGGYYTSFVDLRTMEDKLWRRSKIDNGQYGKVPIDQQDRSISYIICEGNSSGFGEITSIGGIYYIIPSNESSIIKQMDTMVESIILVR